MNLLDIIKATLIELDRGTADDTVAMYKEKFTAYANEAVNEIARRFKMTRLEGVQTVLGQDIPGLVCFNACDLDRPCKRIVHVYKGEYGTPPSPGDEPPILPTKEHMEHPLRFFQPIQGWAQSNGDEMFSLIAVEGIEAGDPILVEYRYVPHPMSVDSLTPTGTPPAPNPDIPELPEYMHSLIPLYVRAREQCGQDPSTQGTSNAYFSLFNQAVYNLQRETLATPESFQLKNYHFE